MALNLKNQKISATTDRFDEPILSFIPAQLKEYSSGWVIEYHVINPETLQLERCREKFQRMRKKYASDDLARKAAKTICRERNKQLTSGWNPFVQEGSIRSFTTMEKALEMFLKEKLKEIRHDTKRVYKSNVNMFIRWLKEHNLESVYVKSFSAINGDDYLTWQYVEQGKSAVTYNNYLTFFRGLFNWFIQKGYCDKNPFTKIQKKKGQAEMPVHLLKFESWNVKVHA